MNLAQVPLTKNQVSVLGKGLNFAPTPKLDKFKLLCEVSNFTRKIKLKAFFNDETRADQSRDDTGLRNKSTFLPPIHAIPVEVLAFENAVLKDIDDLNVEGLKPFHNLSRVEHEAIKQLQSNQDIIIKPADKGGAVVILKTEDYRNECLRLLSDRKTYKILDSDPTSGLATLIGHMVEEALSNGWISKNESDFLIKVNPVIPYFTFLPKFHKYEGPRQGGL